jgi:Tol biopolymer transport system component
VPTWSRDVRWIHFWSSGTGGERNHWRKSTAGGAPEQVTRGGSQAYAIESLDGKSLLYQPGKEDGYSRNGPLLEQPLTGGRPRQLVNCVFPAATTRRAPDSSTRVVNAVPTPLSTCVIERLGRIAPSVASKGSRTSRRWAACRFLPTPQPFSTRAALGAAAT